MRSAITGILAALALLVASAPAPAQASPAPPRVTIALLPNGTDVEELQGIPDLAPGLLSAGIGRVPALQTYLDISQGNRVSESLYDPANPPPLLTPPRGGLTAGWGAVNERADGAPAQILPGLLASTLREAGIPVAVRPYQGSGSLIAADRDGRVVVAARSECPARGCPGLTVTGASRETLDELAARLRGDDLLIAIERPPPEIRLLSFAIAGRDFRRGLLTSDSTRTRGLVTTTDIAPTILERFGVAVPDEMNGEPIRATGITAFTELPQLTDRLEVTNLRRGPVVGQNILAWLALCLLACLLLRRPGARFAFSVLALAGAYLPLLTLVTAAIEPSLLGERLIVGVGAPLLGAATLALLPGWRALAFASLVTVAAFAGDLVAGTGLIPLSIPGPNPSAGSRFFGIGNEVEAIVAALLPIGVGAALASHPATRDGGRSAAGAFLAAGAAAAILFAAGRWGADVGAAITIPAAMAVGAAVTLGSRRGILLVVLAPIVGLVTLALVDVVAGGGAHLTRSVLEAGGLDQAGDVLERRIRLAEQSFKRGDNLPYLAVALGLAALFAWRRRQVVGWFRERSALAGFAGAGAAALVGTVSNDSGAILLILIGAYLAVTAGFAWALRAGEETGAQ